jgi:malonyl-CoA O-methyltransferase
VRDAVDYERIAGRYERRYDTRRYEAIAAALRRLVATAGVGRALEVGCGTGHWLRELAPLVPMTVGVDPSPGMLREAGARGGAVHLVRARANGLPFAPTAFDLVFCVHALHHFDDPRAFVGEAAGTLRPGGTLALVGLDAHVPRESWYVYQYFDGAWETDLRRYPRWPELAAWMAAAGLEGVAVGVVERIRKTWHGDEVLGEPFLDKGATSQLALLSDEAYAAGLDRIRAELGRAAAEGREATFGMDLVLNLGVGRRPRPGIS